MSLLEARSVRREFGGVVAVADVSFTVEEGVIESLIGPNGAGKTTMFNIITGFYPPSAGEVIFDGRRMTGAAPHRFAGCGLVRTFQTVELFPSMTVMENVCVGCHSRLSSGFTAASLRLPIIGREELLCREWAREALEIVGLEKLGPFLGGELPFGQARLVEIARALAAAPRLLMMDEPAAGLNSHETEELGALIQRIKARGITVLLVEHDMDLVMNISDRVVVLDAGLKIAEGSPREVQNDPRVIAAYLGDDGDAAP